MHQIISKLLNSIMKILFIITVTAFLLNGNLLAQSDSTRAQPFTGNLMAQSDSTKAKPVERMPMFPGGQEEMYKYVYSELKYPVEAGKHKISGTVYTQFVVSEEGEIRDIKVIRGGLGYGCDEEAIRVIESMNEDHRWIPGMHNGRPVPVTFTLPIKFFLP